MVRTWAVVLMVAIGYCVGVVADETVDALPDWRVLLARIVAIEERLDTLEGGATIRKSRTVAEPLEVVQSRFPSSPEDGSIEAAGNGPSALMRQTVSVLT